MMGYGMGPLIWAPLCEVKDHFVSTIIPYTAGALFAFGTGASDNLQSVLINRFFTGIFCPPPVSSVGGVLADISHDHDRGAALAAWSLAVSSGPLLADIVGGAIVNSSLSWSWTQYISGIVMSLSSVLALFLVSESHAGTLLVRKVGGIDFLTS